MEDRYDVCTDEDRDFIVDDCYDEVDPTYVPDEEESSDDDNYVVTGKDFVKLTKKAQELGVESLNYSKRKNNKYVATVPGGKKIHFRSPSYPDYLIHKGEYRKDRYLARGKEINNRQGKLTWENPESVNYWSVRLLWNGGK